MAHVRAFELFGVPEAVIPDNLKAAVTRACWYDPDVNPTYLELARRFDTAILPTRAGRPRDKAAIEAAVQVVERWVIAPLRNRRFFSLAELNRTLRERVDEVNSRSFRGMPDSRWDLFKDVEREALRPLPAQRYEFQTVKRATVNIDFKEARALRTETTINDPGDFHIGKRLVNLPALREIGFSANRRLLGAQRLDCDPITGKAVLDHVTKPLTASSGTRVSGLALGDPRSDALFHAIEVFRLMLPGGFRNADLRTLVAQLRGLPEDALTPGQMTYDLRRLREHGLIERVPRTNRYRITDLGLRVALIITRVQERVLRTALTQLLAPAPTTPRLRAAAQAYEAAIDELVQQQLAA